MNLIGAFDIFLEEGEQIDGVDYALQIYTKLMGDEVDNWADHETAFEQDFLGEFRNDLEFEDAQPDYGGEFAKVEVMWGAETAALYFSTTEWVA